jgi:hypothetical protein
LSERCSFFNASAIGVIKASNVLCSREFKKIRKDSWM